MTQPSGKFRKDSQAGADVADPDLGVVAFAGSVSVTLVSPKTKGVTFNDTVEHRGGAKGAGSEVVVIQVDKLAQVDSHITGLGIVATRTGLEGFTRVPGATVRLYDTSTGQRQYIGNVRFVAGWTVISKPVHGYGRTTEEINQFVRSRYPR